MTALGLRPSARLRLSSTSRSATRRFLPTRLPDLAFWYDAVGSTYESGTWHDLSGNGNHAAQPLAARQLVQAKLADMYTTLGQAQLVALRLGRLKEQGRLTPAQVSFAKRANVAAALDAARAARDVLGGVGITLDHPPIRHLLNLETVKTYEGTHDVHTLVLGREITGLDAFS